MRRLGSGAICLALTLWQSAYAQVVSSAPDDVEIAIYRGPRVESPDEALGLAMISEDRTVDLPGGPVTIQFHGVADAIIPQTAKLEGLPTPVIESNFDYDLVSPGAIIAKSVGQPVRIVRTNRNTGGVTEQRAVLRSGPQGVMLEIDGRFEALGCSGMDERLVFDSMPASLAARPTLSMPVNAPAGRYKLRLSYLTLGMSWSADYVAKLNPDGRTLELTGWVTLTNRLAASYPNVPVKAVAGNLSFFAEETVPPGAENPEQSSSCWPIGSFYQSREMYRRFDKLEQPAAAPMMMQARAALEEVLVTGSFIAKQSDLGDYKLYSLPERTNVAANQTKQVRLLENKKVKYQRKYVHRYYNESLREGKDSPPIATLALENKTATGLGLPLPEGTVSVMESTQGRVALAGEDELFDVPVGSPFELELGDAMGIWLKSRVVSEENLDARAGGRTRMEIEIQMGNDKDVAAELELRHEGLAESDVRVTSESKRHMLKYGQPQWNYSLRPGARAALRYTIEFNR